nr:hypothetical protein [uncultured Flavobacterium sp.]
MKTIFTFKDFELETISRKQQQTIKGGEDTTPPVDPVDPKKSAGGGNN